MNETINDILREMREFADADSQSIGRDVLRRDIQHYADRIEAAHERETVTNRNGLNAAKMREALEAIDKNTDLLDIAENIAPKLHPSHSFVAVQIRKIVRTALAAPPRNCERFDGDIDLLREACLRERGLNPEEDFPKVFCEWLLELAKEEEWVKILKILTNAEAKGGAE